MYIILNKSAEFVHLSPSNDLLPKKGSWSMRRKWKKLERVNLDMDSLDRISAQNAEIGGVYLSPTGLRVIVKEKKDKRVVIHSLATGHDVEVPPTYPLTEDTQEQKSGQESSSRVA